MVPFCIKENEEKKRERRRIRGNKHLKGKDEKLETQGNKANSRDNVRFSSFFFLFFLFSSWGLETI